MRVSDKHSNITEPGLKVPVSLSVKLN